MNLRAETSEKLAREIVAGVKGLFGASDARGMGVEVAVCPASPYLMTVRNVVAGTPVALGAQNVYFENDGAFTGEINSGMACDVGCQYVILGHSERRHILGETDADVNRKVKAVLDLPLTPIVCVGELLEEREAGLTHAVVKRQFDGAFDGVTTTQMERVVIAYEPVWAIGTGRVATPEQAEEVHATLRKLLSTHYNRGIADRVRIQYGGSVKASNAGELLAQPNVDGALVGGASLAADSFLAIVAAARDHTSLRS
jgi:triosephosphate isomerase (TIM)